MPPPVCVSNQGPPDVFTREPDAQLLLYSLISPFDNIYILVSTRNTAPIITTSQRQT